MQAKVLFEIADLAGAALEEIEFQYDIKTSLGMTMFPFWGDDTGP